MSLHFYNLLLHNILFLAFIYKQKSTQIHEKKQD